MGNDFIDLESGIPVFSSFPEIPLINIDHKEYFLNNIEKADLKTVLIEKLYTENNINVSSNNIIFTSGAKEAIDLFIRQTIEPKKEVIIIQPAFYLYSYLVKLSRGTPVYVQAHKNNNYIPTISDIEAKISSNTCMIIINSPNNPTGGIYPQEWLASLSALAQKYNIFILSDEVYEKYTYDTNRHYSISAFDNPANPLIFTAFSFSKTFSMSSLRFGYLVSLASGLLENIKKIQNKIGITPNYITQQIAFDTLKLPFDIGKQVSVYDRNRLLISSWLSKYKQISTFCPQGAFYYYLDISKFIGSNINNTIITSSNDFSIAFSKKTKVKVLSCSNFGSNIHVRLCFARPYEIIKTALERIDNSKILN